MIGRELLALADAHALRSPYIGLNSSTTGSASRTRCSTRQNSRLSSHRRQEQSISFSVKSTKSNTLSLSSA